MPWRVNRISREPDSICAGAACTLAPAAAGGAGSAGNGPEGALHGGKDFVLGWEEVAPWAWHDEAGRDAVTGVTGLGGSRPRLLGAGVRVLARSLAEVLALGPLVPSPAKRPVRTAHRP